MKMTSLEKRFVNGGGHSLGVAKRAEQRLRRLPVAPGRTYLDVGCGNGVAALHVADTFRLPVVGVDVDPAQIRLARQTAEGRHDAAFLPADAIDLPFEDGRFDVVATSKTTHHMPEWRRAQAEMASVLRPSGYLIYSDLTLPTWLSARLRSVLGGRAGVFTGEDLDCTFAVLGLHSVYKAARWHSYEAVFVK